MTKSEKREHWFKHYTGYLAYKGTKLSYAELNHLNPKSFRFWCNRFEESERVHQAKQSGEIVLLSLKVKKTSKDSLVSNKSKGFVELQPSRIPTTKLKINLPNISIEFNEYPNCDWLAELSRRVG